MSPDKYSAVWVSYSSIHDFQVCPRSYYLKNIYRDPNSHKKIQIVSAPLSLGQAVHDVVESLSILPTDRRFTIPLLSKFEESWKKVSGKKGGFVSDEVERRYKERGKDMIRRVQDHPGPLTKQAVKIKQDLPWFWLSEDENIILCGKIDWLEYLSETDSVHIIDFKTGKKEESTNSLQLPIYHLLVHYCQKRKVSGMSYWYLEFSDTLTKKELPDLVESQDQVLKEAKKIKLARQLDRFVCPHTDGCFACKPYEAVLRGEGEFIGSDQNGKDVYMLSEIAPRDEEDSVIL